MQNNQQNHIGTFLYLTQIKVVLVTIISSTFYYRFLDSTPFEIIVVFTVSNLTTCTCMRKYRCTWNQSGMYGKLEVFMTKRHMG